MPSPSEPPAVFVNDLTLKLLDANLPCKNTHNPISKDHCNKRKNSDKRAGSAESCSQLPRASRSHFAAGLVAIPGTKLDTSHESSWQSIPMVTENSHDKPVLMCSYADGVVLGPGGNAQFGSLGCANCPTIYSCSIWLLGLYSNANCRTGILHKITVNQSPASRLLAGAYINNASRGKFILWKAYSALVSTERLLLSPSISLKRGFAETAKMANQTTLR